VAFKFCVRANIIPVVSMLSNQRLLNQSSVILLIP